MKEYIDRDKELFRPFSDYGQPFMEGIKKIADNRMDLFAYTS